MKAALIIRLGVVGAALLAAAFFFSGSLRSFLSGGFDGFAISRAETLLAEQKYEAAAGWVRAAAERGSGAAQVMMGRVSAATEDEAQAHNWFERAWSGGEAEGGYQLALMYADERWSVHDEARATETFGQVAPQHAVAAAEYGWRLVNGIGARRDVELGVAQVQGAAAARVPAGLHYLGLLHANGIGVAQDRAQAQAYILEAAQMQHPPAIVWVGDRALEMLEQGEAADCAFLVTTNELSRRARPAADPEGAARAAFIGLASECEGTARSDDVQTLNQPTPFAQYFTALMIERGRGDILGVAADVTAESLYAQAADAGYERAAVRLDSIERAAQAALDRMGHYSPARLRALHSRGLTGWDVVQALRSEYFRRPNYAAATELGVRRAVIGMTTSAWVYDVDRMTCRQAEQGFRCTYKLRSRSVTEAYDQAVFAFMDRLGRRLRNEQDEQVFERTDLFVRGEGGWRSPTHHQRLLEWEAEERRRAEAASAAAASNCTYSGPREIPMYAAGRLEMVPRYGSNRC